MRIDDSKFGMWRAMRCLDAVGVPLAEVVRPLAVADVDLAGRVALDAPRQLLQLDPEKAAAVGRARGVHRQRLADDDGRLRRQQAALGLVHRARDAVEAGREMDDRGAAEPFVSVPARRLRQREVDLHLGAAVAVAARLLGHRRGHVGVGEQPLVELRRRRRSR